MAGKRDYSFYIQDILDAINKIEKYTREVSFDDFLANSLLIDGVVRNLEIIGEAAKNIPLAVKEKYPSLPWREMAGMRDKMAHDYFGVDLNIVWKTVKDSIPKIKSVIKTIIE